MSDALEEAIELNEEMAVELRRLRRDLEELKEDDSFDGGQDTPPRPA